MVEAPVFWRGDRGVDDPAAGLLAPRRFLLKEATASENGVAEFMCTNLIARRLRPLRVKEAFSKESAV